MRFEYDVDTGAFYLEVEDVEDGEIAGTTEVVPGSIFLDRDGEGNIVGIEVLGAESIALLPDLLAANGIRVPLRLGALADVLSRPGPGSATNERGLQALSREAS